jgi:hypothetical protein
MVVQQKVQSASGGLVPQITTGVCIASARIAGPCLTIFACQGGGTVV